MGWNWKLIEPIILLGLQLVNISFPIPNGSWSYLWKWPSSWWSFFPSSCYFFPRRSSVTNHKPQRQLIVAGQLLINESFPIPICHKKYIMPVEGSGWGWWGGELGYQEEEEGSKRRGRMHCRCTWESCWGGAGGGGEDDTHTVWTYHATIDCLSCNKRFIYSVFTKDTSDEKGQARDTRVHVTL